MDRESAQLQANLDAIRSRIDAACRAAGRDPGEVRLLPVTKTVGADRLRIAHALGRLVVQAGRRTAEGIEIAFPLSRQDLAEMAGTTLHTVSRTLSAWEGAGIVLAGRQRVVIARPHALVAIAEDLPGEAGAQDS